MHKVCIYNHKGKCLRGRIVKNKEALSEQVILFAVGQF